MKGEGIIRIKITTTTTSSTSSLLTTHFIVDTTLLLLFLLLLLLLLLLLSFLGPAHLKDELEAVEGRGGEGLMLRQAMSHYAHGSRSKTLLKVSGNAECGDGGGGV
jgi:hypothetical protein